MICNAFQWVFKNLTVTKVAFLALQTDDYLSQALSSFFGLQDHDNIPSIFSSKLFTKSFPYQSLKFQTSTNVCGSVVTLP